ncbi:hypothetical protein [Chachezhania antarctica]|uniref:hypothetical protein n=1 Tax=Chachezhania antarctica TaxID=2340860 RepID=UPI000EAEE33A|nr:hypothetical protein [Chachezhania antarctica]|tara:strand:- start:4679 stop:5530 length:852 start_codon:yes stop_codon:yes gene_type:complete
MNRPFEGHDAQGLTERGVGPFVTFRSYLHQGRLVHWRARQHRKGLLQHPDQVAAFWQKPAYNWWTGLSFSIGSLLFMLGATLSLTPNPLSAVQIAIIFFMGSIPFTIAGFLQNFQAANAGDFSSSSPARPDRISIVGWETNSLGWISTFAQFLGTIAFNFNTFDAIDPVSGWYQQDLTIWLPGFIGSVLFLVSGYLAFMETSHGYWSWKPGDLDWKIVFINLLGCIFFMIAGIVSFIPKGTDPEWLINLANVHLWLGAFCFLTGALLMMRESRQTETVGDQKL